MLNEQYITHTTMDNKENIEVDNGLVTVEVSQDGVITITVNKGEKSTVYTFDTGDPQTKVVVKETHGGSHAATEKLSLEDRARIAIQNGAHLALRQLIGENGLSDDAIIPETGRNLLQELCVTGSDKGFADCLRVLLARGVNPNSRVAATGGTILHLLAEHGSLLKWDRTVNVLSKPMLDDLLRATDNDGNTPLHIAAKRGMMDIYSLVYGLCGPNSEQSKAKNKYGSKPHEVLNANCLELATDVYFHTEYDEDKQRLKDDPEYRAKVYAAERHRTMLKYMTRFFYNSIHCGYMYD